MLPIMETAAGRAVDCLVNLDLAEALRAAQRAREEAERVRSFLARIAGADLELVRVEAAALLDRLNAES